MRISSCVKKKNDFKGSLSQNERNDRPNRYLKFFASFKEDHEFQPLHVEIGTLVFPAAGHYCLEIIFVRE
jgi:hypothetical protein